MIDLTALMTEDISDRLRSMATLGEGYKKLTVHVMRSVLTPLAGNNLSRAKRLELDELWQTSVVNWQQTVVATPLWEFTERDTLTVNLVSEWLDGSIDGVREQLGKSLKGLALGTAKREFTQFRQICELIGTPKALECRQLSYAWGSPITNAANEKSKQALASRLVNQTVVSRSAMVKWVDDYKDTSDWVTAAHILSVCTGRRMIELFARGEFAWMADNTFRFSGQAKMRNSHEDLPVVYPIWHLTSAEAARLFSFIEPRRLPSDCGDRAVNVKFSSGLSKCKAKPYLPEWRFKMGRDLYVGLTIYDRADLQVNPMVQASRLLGHWVDSTGVSTSALNYMAYPIVP